MISDIPFVDKLPDGDWLLFARRTHKKRVKLSAKSYRRMHNFFAIPERKKAAPPQRTMRYVGTAFPPWDLIFRLVNLI